jgi:hypothetical protein
MAVVLAAGVVSALQLGDRGNTEVLTVAGAAEATAAARTARVTMRMSFSESDAAALGGSSETLTGSVDFEHHRFTLKGKFVGVVTELRGIGKDRWIMQAGLPGLDSGKKWVHNTDTDAGFEEIDPAKLLDRLTSKGTVMSRKADGDRTAFVLRVPADVLTPGGPGAEDGAYDVVTLLVDADNRVRVLTTTLEAGTTGSGGVDLEMSYDDFGIEVDVRPPPADEVQEASAAVSGGTSESFSVTSSGSSMSPEDRKRVCEQIKAFKAQQPTPRTAEEKARQQQFDDGMAQACKQ